jgi:hypothetical protein
MLDISRSASASSFQYNMLRLNIFVSERKDKISFEQAFQCFVRPLLATTLTPQRVKIILLFAPSFLSLPEDGRISI